MNQTFDSKHNAILFRTSLVPVEPFSAHLSLHDEKVFFGRHPKISMTLNDGQTRQLCLPSLTPGEKTVLPYGARMIRTSNDCQLVLKHDITQDGIVYMVFTNYDIELKAFFAEWMVSCLVLAMASAHSARLSG
jgi:hypothetical protein